ncbi:hypothetical protein D3C77_573740 [compost metagenome]
MLANHLLTIKLRLLANQSLAVTSAHYPPRTWPRFVGQGLEQRRRRPFTFLDRRGQFVFGLSFNQTQLHLVATQCGLVYRNTAKALKIVNHGQGIGVLCLRGLQTVDGFRQGERTDRQFIMGTTRTANVLVAQVTLE